MSSTLAVLDLGTNSTRFLSVSEDGPIVPESVVDRGMVVTRLGEDVDETGRIAPGARKRVVETVGQFNHSVRQHGGRWVGAVATSACRRASNSSVETLFDAIEDVIGVRPELVSGRREAELIYRGVTASLPGLDAGQVVDIGGGSSEWITFDPGGLRSARSHETGVVTLYERCSHETVCTSEDAECMMDVLDEELIPRNTSKGPLVCVGGTGTTLVSLNLGLEAYDPVRVHGHELKRGAIDTLYEGMLGTPFEEIAQRSTIESGREQVIIPGMLILKKSMSEAQTDSARVSDMGILAGRLSEARSA